MEIKTLLEIIEDSWKKIGDLTKKQIKFGIERPFRRDNRNLPNLGHESWITAELYHQLKSRIDPDDLEENPIFISTDIKPILQGDNIDLGITQIGEKSLSYLFLLEVKHSDPWNLLHYNRGANRGDYRGKYENKTKLTFEEAYLPSNKLGTQNLLYDLYRLKNVVKSSNVLIKVIGIAYIIEYGSQYVPLDILMKKCVYDRGMIYPQIIESFPSFKFPEETDSDVYYVELKGGDRPNSEWIMYKKLFCEIHQKMEIE